MRIVFVAYEHPLITPGGAQQVAFELFQAALSAGHDASFIAALEDHHAERYARAGAGIVAIPGFAGQFLYSPAGYDYESLSVADEGSLAAFRAAIAELAPDVVHFHHYHRVGASAIRAARQAAPRAEISLTLPRDARDLHGQRADGQEAPGANSAAAPSRTPARPASAATRRPSSPSARGGCAPCWKTATISSFPPNSSPSFISTGA